MSFITNFNFKGINMSKSHTNNISIDPACCATMDGANLQGCKLDRISFVNGNLKEANLHLCKLDHTSFINANLKDANLSESSLLRADFSKGIYRNTQFN